MERVVYLLGAGFSAPAGLPVMSNFLEKAKDMLYLSERDEFAHFAGVLERVNHLSVIKNYFKSDLFNIEEILSILEIKASVSLPGEREGFIRFISDVIRFYSAAFDRPIEPKVNTGNWYDFIFGDDLTVAHYGFFALSLFNTAFHPIDPERPDLPRLKVAPSTPRQTSYSVITLNYDRLLENPIDSINKVYKIDRPLKYEYETYDPDWKVPHVAKLHGDVEKGNIVPPTWSKAIAPEISSSWRIALHLLSECNHIRIVGYSLPISDAYIKYLLKAGILENHHLKTIDVICLDNVGDVERRYAEFVDDSFKSRYRFKNGSVADYLQMLRGATTKPTSSHSTIKYSLLEEVHSKFME